jgi:uncharacterized protein (TIGR03085 family)
VGPDAPTLCEGWTTADLATHLIVRERKPLAGPGLVLGRPFKGLLDREMARTKSSHSYDALVALVRSGPPRWLRPVDSLINLNEFFVHHEDVRRGGGDHTPRPADQIADLEAVLWRALRPQAGFLARRVRGTGLDLVRPDGQVIRARRGTPKVTVAGRAGEIVLYLMGRRQAAQIEIDGPPDAVATVTAASFGL